MKSKLRILLLEDDIVDAALIAHELDVSGFSFRLARIQTEAELRHELEIEQPDLILSDHGLPSFDGFRALEIVRETLPELPFIFVSGSNDQGMVEEMYELGATDYVFKRDLGDLKTVVRQALEPQSEAIPLPVALGTIPAQPELKLQLPAISAAQTTFPQPIGRLSFCPQCRQARDETGRLIQLENYCGTHSEIVVLRQFCGYCSHPVLLS